MKYSFVAIATLAALAQAQTRADIPACALPCLDAAVTKDTKCSTSDFTCICKNFDAVQADATPCVIEKCGTDVAISKVLPATQALCKAAAAGGSSSSAAQSSPAQQSSSSSSSAAQQSTTAPQQTSSAASSAASAPPSSAPAQTTSAAQTTPAGPVGSGTGVVPPPAGNKTTTGAPAHPTSGSSTILPGLALVAALCAFAL